MWHEVDVGQSEVTMFYYFLETIYTDDKISFWITFSSSKRIFLHHEHRYRHISLRYSWKVHLYWMFVSAEFNPHANICKEQLRMTGMSSGSAVLKCSVLNKLGIIWGSWPPVLIAIHPKIEIFQSGPKWWINQQIYHTTNMAKKTKHWLVQL